ncbi:MAG: helix-turn-helix transcriptional regulator [Firmicutes bacterium]|nr:helix-turn-helix transcriptional regulator [Bacillota bacterium]
MCGMFIKQLRCEKGWTQAELANRLSVTDKAVSRWETGKGYPEVTIIPELAKILDVTIGELLSGQRILPELQQNQTEKLLLENLKGNRDRMVVAGGGLIICSIVMVILALNLWRGFGYGSDAFSGFHRVMENGGFGFLSQVLMVVLPLISIGLSGYILWEGDRSEKNRP